MKTNINQKEFYESKKERQSKLNKFLSQIRMKWQGPGTPFQDYYINVLKQLLNDLKGKKVLEFGIGPNHPVSFHIAKECQEYTVVDLAESRIKRYANKLKTNNINNVQYIVGDIMKVNLPLNHYDVVAGFGVIHHIKDIKKIMARVKNLLRKSGYGVFFDPLDTEPFIMFFRFVTRPFRPNLKWEYPLKPRCIMTIKSIFPDHKLIYMNAFAKLSLPFALMSQSKYVFKKVFNLFNSIDIKILQYSFFKLFSWQVAIRVNKTN